MRYYETMFIVRPSVEDEGLNTIIDKVKAFFEKHKVEIAQTVSHGKKKLAYEIKKNRRGYYIQLNYYADPSFISELRRFFVISDDIIRDLTLVINPASAVSKEELPLTADRDDRDRRSNYHRDRKFDSR